MSWEVHHADCVEAMAEMDEASVDTIVCDPPYSLGFMGKAWDRNLNHGPWATEALRVVKPGGHLLAFGGTRTYHRLACAIEDAGFEIRDSVIWLYGSGFPKSLDVSKAIDKAAGAEREVIGKSARHIAQGEAASSSVYAQDEWTQENGRMGEFVTAPATPEAEKWNGWGTALKPAHEPIVVARKPLIGTVAANVQAHGTGALNIDGCRIGTEVETWPASRSYAPGQMQPGHDGQTEATGEAPAGRWPANVTLSHLPECERVGTRKVRSGNSNQGVVHGTGEGTTFLPQKESGAHYADLDGTETVTAYNCAPGCPVAELDRQSGELKPPGGPGRQAGYTSDPLVTDFAGTTHSQGPLYLNESGGASRFFAQFRYVAKASRSERNAGLDGFEEQRFAQSGGGKTDAASEDEDRYSESIGLNRVKMTRNPHPTVKPIALMRWLCRLVTPPGGTVLDPFTGSGTTGIAAHLEGFDFVGIERELEYVEIARARIGWWVKFPPGTEVEAALGIETIDRTHRDAGQGTLL